MKKLAVIKRLVMIGVFFASLVIFSIITNHTNEDLTVTMGEATLPVVSFDYNDIAIDELHGYVSEMDVSMVRDSIIPVDSDRMLNVNINTYGADIDKITYEIRGLDGERLVADGEIDEYNVEGNRIGASFQVQNLLENNEEYVLIFQLDLKGKPVYYYSRIMKDSGCYAAESLKFAKKFHEYTFSDLAGDFIPLYLDARSGDESSLSYVDLTCGIKQITWADFNGKIYNSVSYSFKEINSSYNVVMLNYVLCSTNDNGENEYYNVTEYYRLRYTETRMYVLNFERTMNQIFKGENTFISDNNYIDLGIRDKDVTYKTNDAGDVVAFVQEGDLWCYNIISDELEQVYSFRSSEGIDIRENYDEHDINIVRVDEAGSVDFIVYGYMNRGDHEGQVGISVCHYDGIAHTVEEEVFIPVTSSYEVLQAELGQLLFENDVNCLYVMMNGSVYEINMDSLKVKVLIDGLRDGSYAISGSGKYFAWVDPENEYQSESISLMDLSTGNVYDVKASASTYLRPLGFIDEDFIYGVANKDDVISDGAGNIEFKMSELNIMNTSEDSHDIVKTYTPISGFIKSITVDDNSINVELTSGSDSIMNREVDENSLTYITSIITDVKETQIQIVPATKIKSNKTKLITSKCILAEENHEVKITDTDKQDRFYVYQKGNVGLATDSISDAISMANENCGVVVDADQNYIWMRARKTAVNPVSSMKVNEADKESSSIVQAVSAILEKEDAGMTVKDLIAVGQTPKQVMESALKEHKVVDITGCDVEEVLYYLSKGSLVFAMTSDDSAVIITGYSSSNIYYYMPRTAETKKMTLQKASKYFEEAGNVFYTYAKLNKAGGDSSAN